MKYDFESIIDRKGKDAICVDGIGKLPGFAPATPDEGFDVIPMWIADQNFATVPTIQEAIIERVKHPAFGYFMTKDEYFNEIIEWHKKRNGVQDLTKECIGYENGVLGGVISALGIFCSKGDKVLLHSPTYIGFTMVIEDNGYKIIHSPMKLDEKGKWRMDYEDMEKKIVDNKIHCVVMCNPHNPCGRVWEREELEKAVAIFEKHEVNIISDEIWSDLILFNNKHIPLQSVNAYAKKHTIAFYAPSKTFNLSGLIGSYHIIFDKTLRDRMEKESHLSHYNDMNVLSMYAVIGAYKPEGYEWLDQLLKVLTANIDYADKYIKQNFKGVTCSTPEGTYMMFVDCTKWCEEHKKTIDDVEKECHRVGVAIQDGKMFHGPCHIRMNLALPLSRVKEAFDRLDKYVFNAK